MEIIKQFGLQRSGTNALKAIIEENYDFRLAANILGDKHGTMSWQAMDAWAADADLAEELGSKEFERLLFDLRERQLKFVISIKDPISWLNSYFRYAKKKYQYKNPGKTLNFSHRFGENSMKSWYQRVASYASFVADNSDLCFVVQHEQLLSDPQRVLNDFRLAFDLPSAENPQLFLEGYARRGTEDHHGKMLINQKMHFDRDYHLEGRWLEDVPKDVLGDAIKYRDEIFSLRPDIKKLFCYETAGLLIESPG